MKEYGSKFTIAVRFTIACLALLSVAISASAETSAPVAAAQLQGSNQQAGGTVTPPSVPDRIKVKEGFVPFFLCHGDHPDLHSFPTPPSPAHALVFYAPSSLLPPL